MADFMITDIIEQEILSISSEWEKEGISAEEIMQRIEGLDFKNAYTEIIDKASDDLLEFMKLHMFEISHQKRVATFSFVAHMEEIWGKCFVASEMMYYLACDAGENFGKYVREKISEEDKTKNLYTFRSLQSIHGRACQIFLEILYLMKLGFADAAYARWRTIYELCCIGTFIRHQSEQIAEQYWNYSQTDQKGYKWADGAKQVDGREPPKWSFKQIQQFCDTFHNWNEHYNLACFLVHASAQGTFKRLSNFSAHNAIPVGQSDYGIHIPAEHSALCLQWITTEFITIHPYLEGLAECKTLAHLSHYIQEIYSVTNDECFPNTKQEDVN